MNESNAMALADNAMGAVDWDALHARSAAIFDAVHRGSSLALQSGLYGVPPVDPAQAAMDRYKQYIPLQQARGPVESVRDAFSLQRDEQGIPKAPGIGDTINAALWAVPGARGTIRPEPFQRPPAASNFNRSPEGMARDKLRKEVLDGKAAYEAKLREQFGEPAKLDGKNLVLNTADIQEAVRRRLLNSEALANGAQPNVILPRD